MAQQRVKRNEILKSVLFGLGAAGVLTAAIVCPNIVQLIPREYTRRYPKKSLRQAICRLDKKGWLVLQKTPSGWSVKLTALGRAELQQYELGEKFIQLPKTWDKKWHVLIFDIAEEKRCIRDCIRGTLQGLGFVRLQNSIWIYPYPCKEILELLRTKHNARHDALYLTVDPFDNDRWLRKHFHLEI